MSEINHLISEERETLGGRFVVVVGHGLLAVPATRRLAVSGIGSFLLLASTQSQSQETQSELIQTIQEFGADALIRIVQVGRFDTGDYLYPDEIDLVVDCCVRAKDHEALEQACRAHGVPMVLAFADENVTLTGLVDPYAESLAMIFGMEGETNSVKHFMAEHACVPGDRERDLEQSVDRSVVEYAAWEIERHALDVILGRASFFESSLENCDRTTGRLKRYHMPVRIPRYPRIVLVGSDRRKLAKTSLCVALARELTCLGRPVRMLKIQNKGQAEPVQVLEESPHETKESVRDLFDAGCERVVRLIATDGTMRDALPCVLDDLYETMSPDGVLLCESSTARQFLQPGFFIHLTAGDRDIKTSALRSRRLADRTIVSPFTDGDAASLAQQIDEIVTRHST